MQVAFNPAALSVDDGIELETLCGKAVSEIDWEHPSLLVVKALIYITERQKNPDFTFEDAGKLKITAIEVVQPDPTDDAVAS